MIKKFIRGNVDRRTEVIKSLEDLGGNNYHNHLGNNPNTIYYIDQNNIIQQEGKGTTLALVMQEHFEELELPEKNDKVITNLDVAKWYFHMLHEGHAVQFMYCTTVYDHLLPYVCDTSASDFDKVRIDFGEWIPIKEAGII